MTQHAPALVSLAREVWGIWGAFEKELRQAIGNTNYNVMARKIAEAKVVLDLHASDCAVHSAPALPVGACDCGADESTTVVEGWRVTLC